MPTRQTNALRNRMAGSSGTTTNRGSAAVPPHDPKAMLLYAAEALELATGAGAAAQPAWSHECTASALHALGQLDEAIAMPFRAAETFRAIGDVDSYVQSLAHVANCLRDDGRHAEALEQLLALLALMDDEGSGMTPSVVAHSRPFALIRIGQCLGHLGRRAEAIVTLGEAMDLLDTLQVSDYRHAEGLEALAALLAEEGRTGESRRTYARAARVFASIGDTEAGSRCRILATTAP
ncbi:hypothetical protein ABT237_39040 [Streptomyces sp. NPDC001581]|uniref:hypothetical protein n=1 Tax=Streptomyces sp. NPDC001581 TaxID=3154386 RepID=UPI00331F69C4